MIMDPIIEAIHRGDEAQVVELCNLTQPGFSTSQAFAAIFIAASLGHERIATNLLSALICFNPTENYFSKKNELSHRTFLHEALLFKQLDFAINFIRKTDPPFDNIVDEGGYTLLHLASKLGLIHVVDEILKLDPNTGCISKNGKTALYLAVKYHQIGVLKSLLAYPLDINKSYSPNNETVMHIAARSGFSDVVALLLQYNPILTENTLGDTPYHIAQNMGHRAVADMILHYQNQNTVDAYQALLMSRMTIDSEPLTPHRNYLLKFPAWQETVKVKNKIEEIEKIEEKECIEGIFNLGQNLAHRAVYAHPPDGLDIIVGDEYCVPYLYRSYTIFNQSGIRCYAWIPHEKGQEVYILLAGTDNEASLKRDVTEITPGYKSFKNQARVILKNLSYILAEMQGDVKDLKITIAGHSLGGGDSYALFIALLKCMSNNALNQLGRSPDERALYEMLKSNWPARSLLDVEIMRQKALQNTMDSTYKGLDFSGFYRIRVIALNSVLISNKAQLEYEGIVTYLKLLRPELKLEAYNLIIPSDFANLTGDTYPLIHLPPEILKFHMKITNVNPYALEAGMGMALMGMAMNPAMISKSNINMCYGMLIAGGVAAFALGPISIVPMMLLAGGGVKASHILFDKAASTIAAPHQHLPDFNGDPESEVGVIYLSNIDPDLRKKMIQAIESKQFAKIIFGIVKQGIAHNLKG